MREISGSNPSHSFYAAKRDAPAGFRHPDPIWGRVAIGAVVGWLVVLAIVWIGNEIYGHWNRIGNEALGMGIFIVLAGIALAIYFLPSYIAMKRKHKNFAAIFALNLLAGWSFFGWVIALVWALKND